MGYSPWGRKELGLTEERTHTHTHIALIIVAHQQIINDVDNVKYFILVKTF